MEVIYKFHCTMGHSSGVAPTGGGSGGVGVGLGALMSLATDLLA